ncbi:ACT domain-containing protein [Patescibacteria group bacterium]
MKHYYKVTLKVRNEAGVLARISTLIRKYRVNIRSLDVAPIDVAEKFSEIHMVFETDKDLNAIGVVMSKLERLVPVIGSTCTPNG